MKKQILSEEFLRMQKLAGLITESEENEIASQKKLLDTLQKKIQDPRMIKKAEKIVNNLSDKEKQDILNFVYKTNESLIKEINLEDLTNKLLSSPGAENTLQKLSTDLTESNSILKELDDDTKGVLGFLSTLGTAAALKFMEIPVYQIAAENPKTAIAAVSTALLSLLALTIKNYSKD